jgi:hypothetical protein
MVPQMVVLWSVLGPPGSGSISQRYGSGSGSGSSPFLTNVLSGLKKCLQNKIITQISKNLIFKTEDDMPVNQV